MTLRLRTAVAVLVAAVIAGAGGVLLWQWATGPAGQHRPPFSLPDVSGELRRVGEWDGEIVVLNFWATWCAPCREEMPLFTELQQRLGKRGVQFVGVAVDRLEPVKRFLEEYGITYPNLHGIAAAMEVQRLYGNEAETLPYTVVIARDGTIRHIFPRQVRRGELEPILERMLAAG